MTRRGMTVLELLLASALLAVLMTFCLQMLSAAADQRRAAGQRQTAIREAANLMERLAAMPLKQLTTEGTAAVQLSQQARAALPDGELEIDVTSPAEQPDARRIALSLRWQDRAGRFVRPVRLVAWRYEKPQNPKADDAAPAVIGNET